MSFCFMVAELEFVRNPAPDAGKKTANPSSANQKPPVMTGQSGGFTLSKLHSPGSPSRTSALLRLPNPSLGILKSVTSLDIYRFIAFMPGCAPKVKPAFSSSFPKLRHLTSVTHLTF